MIKNNLYITKEWLEKNKACEEGKQWFLNQSKTIATEVLEALVKENLLDWANWAITKLMSHKQQILFACYAAKLSLKFFERRYPSDKRPRQAIQAAIRYAKNPTEKNRSAAESAESAAWSAAELAARLAAWSAAWSAAESAELAARSAESAESAAWSAAESAARSAESAESAAAESAAWHKIFKYGITLLKIK